MTAIRTGSAAAVGSRSRTARTTLPRTGSLAAAWWLAPPVAFLAVFFILPLAQIVWQSFGDKRGVFAGLANWQHELGSASLYTALGTTVEIAFLSTAGCLVIGTFLALALAFVPFPGSRLIVRVIESVVSFPSFLIPLAFSILYGRTGVLNSALAAIFPGGPAVDFVNDVPGVVLAEIAFYTPFVVRPLMAAFGQLPRELIDVAGSLGSGPVMTVARIVLPAARPALAAAGGLTFLLTMNEFGIILFTGAKNVLTLPMLIYSRSIVTFDFPSAAVIACIQVTLSLGVYGLYRWAFRILSGENHAAA